MTLISTNRKKRNREEIIASILNSARHGSTKTRIMYSSLLSFSQLQKYLSSALVINLIYLDIHAKKYLITSKGLEFLKRFEELRSIEDSIIEKRKVLLEILGNGEI